MTEEASWHRKARPSGAMSQPPPQCTLLETTLHILPHTHLRPPHSVMQTNTPPPLHSRNVLRGSERAWSEEGIRGRAPLPEDQLPTTRPSRHSISSPPTPRGFPSPPLPSTKRACSLLRLDLFLLESLDSIAMKVKESRRPAPRTATQDACVCATNLLLVCDKVIMCRADSG